MSTNAVQPNQDRAGIHEYVGTLFNVSGSGVVVTGAAKGLGFAIASALVRAGAHVTLLDTDASALDRAVAMLATEDPLVRGEVVDVRDVDQVEGALARAAERNGLDVVFANAGIAPEPGMDQPQGTIDRLDKNLWDRVIDVNLHGCFNTLRPAARHMVEARHGRIIITASNAGLRGDSKVGYAYVTSKAAVINLVRQAALELAPHGVTVNAIAPGPFKTNIGGVDGNRAEVQQGWAETVPLGRMAEPGEIAGLAILLASPAADFMTGSVYPIDGGTVAGWKL